VDIRFDATLRSRVQYALARAVSETAMQAATRGSNNYDANKILATRARGSTVFVRIMNIDRPGKTEQASSGAEAAGTAAASGTIRN
jgi:hypothetical protein